jgi:hypothetical protein
MARMKHLTLCAALVAAADRARYAALCATVDDHGNVGDGSPEAQAEMLRLCSALKAR